MEKKITVELRRSYGRELIYPVCPQAKVFTELTKTTTLSKDDIQKIKQLGYEIITQQEIVKL